MARSMLHRLPRPGVPVPARGCLVVPLDIDSNVVVVVVVVRRWAAAMAAAAMAWCLVHGVVRAHRLHARALRNLLARTRGRARQ